MSSHDAAKESFIKDFGAHLASNQGAVFCGAGVSVKSGIPLWNELLDKPRKTLGLDTAFSDAPLVAQYFVNNVIDGKQQLERMIEASLQGGVDPSKVHRLVAALPATEFWTTNYDTCLERAMSDAVVRFRDEDLATNLLAGGKVLFKMHGSLDADGSIDLDRIVLTRDSYERYVDEWPRMWSRLVSTFSSASMLFLGFSFTDPNVEQIFRLARLRFQGRKREHFAVIRLPEEQKDLPIFEYQSKELQRVGVRVVPIHSYDEIEGLLSRLLVVARPPKVFVSGSYRETVWDGACERLGRALEGARIEILSGSGAAGRAVSYAAARAARHEGRYRPEVFTFFWRSIDRRPAPLRERLGTVKFMGDNYDELRTALVGEARAVVVIGGRSGTAQEVSIAQSGGVPVVPIASTGGKARDLWMEMKDSSLVLGGRAVATEDFAALASPDIDSAVDAAVRLLKQAMYLG